MFLFSSFRVRIVQLRTYSQLLFLLLCLKFVSMLSFYHFHTNKSFNKYEYEIIIIIIIMISVTFNNISTEKKKRILIFSLFFLFFPKVKGKVL